MMSQLVIYEVSNSLEKSLSQLITKIYDKGDSVVIFSPIEEHIVSIDTMLWTFSKNSFIPHQRIGMKFSEYCNILLTHEEEYARHNAKTLIMLDNFEYEKFLDNKEKIIIFIHQSDYVERLPITVSNDNNLIDFKYWTEDKAGHWKAKQFIKS